MKFIFRTLLALGLVAISTTLAASALAAANNPFVGDWKLDPTRSKLTDVMKVERLNSNKYTFDFGADKPETIVIDGSDQSGVSGTTLSVSVEGPDDWKVVRKKDGRMLLTANWKLSKDGNMLTDNFNQSSPNGTISTVDYVYQRKGPGSGFAGTWVSTSAVVNFVYVLQIRPYRGRWPFHHQFLLTTNEEHETRRQGLSKYGRERSYSRRVLAKQARRAHTRTD